MKILVMYEYPANPSGLSTQGDLLYRGLREEGVDVYPVHYESKTEKNWYYRWFKPDVVIGVGYWGYSPQIILDPLDHGMLPVPWLVADGYIANYRDELNSLPLLLVTSNWVKEVYERDGIHGNTIDILPVGCDTDQFTPLPSNNIRVREIRNMLGVTPSQLLILTAGGDAASKGAREILQALALMGSEVPDWRYVCKVWPQPRTVEQNQNDYELACELGIEDRFSVVMDMVSRSYMPALINACDIYAAPSRLEGFGMSQVEAGACGKPVISINAMGMRDTLVHGVTALLASVAVENRISETILGPESGYEPGYKLIFNPPRVADYRANVQELASFLKMLLTQPDLREKLGNAGRQRAVDQFNYREVARKFLKIVHERLGIS